MFYHYCNPTLLSPWWGICVSCSGPQGTRFLCTRKSRSATGINGPQYHGGLIWYWRIYIGQVWRVENFPGFRLQQSYMCRVTYCNQFLRFVFVVTGDHSANSTMLFSSAGLLKSRLPRLQLSTRISCFVSIWLLTIDIGVPSVSAE